MKPQNHRTKIIAIMFNDHWEHFALLYSRVRYTMTVWMKRFASQALHMDLCYLWLKVLENVGVLASICPILMPVSPLLSILVKRSQALQSFFKCLNIMWEKKNGWVSRQWRDRCAGIPYLNHIYLVYLVTVYSMKIKLCQFWVYRAKWYCFRDTDWNKKSFWSSTLKYTNLQN